MVGTETFASPAKRSPVGYFQNSWRPEITSAVTSTADLLPRTSEVGWEAEVSGGRENVSS